MPAAATSLENMAKINAITDKTNQMTCLLILASHQRISEISRKNSANKSDLPEIQVTTSEWPG
ncbi:MAG: hypothetical protein ABIC40_07440 [bacterium]